MMAVRSGMWRLETFTCLSSILIKNLLSKKETKIRFQGGFVSFFAFARTFNNIYMSINSPTKLRAVDVRISNKENIKKTL